MSGEWRNVTALQVFSKYHSPLTKHQKILFDCFYQLIADALHALGRRVAVLLVDVVELDEGNVVVLADFAHRLVDGLAELGVEQGVDAGLGVALLQLVEQAGEGRTEILAVVFGPVGILVFANGRVGPSIIGATKYEDDVRIAQTIYT